jgi:predicted nucleic acid-binding Zn ribbon protein
MKETMTCPICNVIFFPTRKDARFCSAKCRKRANREKVSAKGKLNQTIYDIVSKHLYSLAGMGAQNSIKAIVLLGLNLLDESGKRKIYESLKDYEWRRSDEALL